MKRNSVLIFKLLNFCIVAATLLLTLSGCGIYNKYEQKTESPADLFGSAQDVQMLSGSESLVLFSQI